MTLRAAVKSARAFERCAWVGTSRRIHSNRGIEGGGGRIVSVLFYKTDSEHTLEVRRVEPPRDTDVTPCMSVACK